MPYRRSRFLVVAALLAWLVPAVAFAARPYVEGEVIVRYKNGPSATERASIRGRMHGNSKRKFNVIDAEVLRVEGMTVEQAIEAVRGNPKVAYAEPNYEWHLFITPNDPRFPEMWSLQNTGQTGGTPGADIRATNAWDVFTGDPNLLIGVIDTGVDYTHPDLVENVWTNPGEIPGNGVDDDNNGYVDDIHGYDFYNNDGDPMDDHSHGTHVSGTIAARGNNGIGTVGINWNAKIVGIKFIGAGGSGSTEGAIAAIQYAIAVGVRLTNNSWGGGGYSVALQDAIEAAGAAGQLFVAAAGNDYGNNNDVNPVYPVSYPSAAIVGVAATTHQDLMAAFSNYGPTTVDLAAPGQDILSTVPGGYSVFSGTSMATPHVTGTLALMMGRSPGLTGAAAKARLLATVDTIPAVHGLVLSNGRLNALMAIADPDTIPPGAVGDLAAGSPTSNTVTLSWHATGDDGNTGRASTYDVRYSTSPITSGNFDSAARATIGVPTPLPAGTAQSFELVGLNHSTGYFFALRAFDEFSNFGPISNVANATTLGPPDITATPTSFHEALLTGATVSRTLTLRNDGQGTLDFTIPNADPVTTAQHVFGELPTVKGEHDPRVGPVVTDDRGGPDAFGYRWVSSDDPAGPAFDWVDITGIGTRIESLVYDEHVETGIPIGFDFPFYGARFDSLNVCPNGWLSFTSALAPTYSNQPLPNAGSGTPENLVAPFWTDLNFAGTPHAYVYRDPSRFVLSWVNVPHYAFGGSYTFQVMLYRSGEIRYQYLDLLGPREFATVGIQDQSKSVGLNIVFNSYYIHGGQAIQILPPLHWLDATPRSGRILAGASQNVSVNFDAAELFGGTYQANLRVASNDPDEPTVTLPVQLDVTGVTDIAVSPTALDFGLTFVGGTARETLFVSNLGTDTLRVASITPSHPAYGATPSAFALGPFTSMLVLVRFQPTAAGGAPATLEIHSNDPDEAIVSVAVAGIGIEPPDIAVSPDSLSADLLSSDTTSRVLHVSNTGVADLDVTVFVEGELGASRARLGGDSGPSRIGTDPPSGVGFTPAPPTLNRSPQPTAARTLAGSYTGTYLAFGISDYGEVMPYQYPIGNEHLQEGAFVSGYTIGTQSGPIQQVYYASYDSRSGIVPISYQELVNTPERVEVAVVVKTIDDRLTITRRFTFPRDQKFVKVRTNVENSSGQTIEGLVVKEFADWDVDADFSDDTFDLDPEHRMAYATDIKFVAIAGADEPDLIDMFGWPDYGRYVTEIEYPVGPLPNFDGLELLHFERGTLLVGAQTSVSTAYCAADDLEELRRLADIAAPSASWLQVSPSTVRVPGGQSVDLNVLFDARGLFGGDYHAHIVVASNDPDEAEVRIPAFLHVTGVPDIAVAQSLVDFGARFIGVARRETLTVANEGTDTLHVTTLVNHADFSAATPSFTIAPLSAYRLILTMVASSTGPRSATLTLNSNDADEPSIMVALTGTGLIPPVAHVAPESLSVTLFTGGTTTRSLRLSNAGGSNLDFEVHIASDSGAVPPHAVAPAIGIGSTSAASTRFPRPLGSGTRPPRGPGQPIDPGDATAWSQAGLRAGLPMSSPLPPPSFDGSALPIVVEDPVGDATEVDLARFRAASAEGEFRGRLEMATPFDPTNFGGYLSIDIDQNPATGVPPIVGLPTQDIGADFYIHFFSIEFGLTDLYDLPFGNYRGTFPVTLNPTGFDFAIPLGAMNGDDGALDIDGIIGSNFGPTDWFPDVGHGTVSSNSWLEVVPDRGTVAQGSFLDLEARFDAAGLNGGDYRAIVRIESNDPGPGGVLQVPVRLHVIGAPDLAIAPTSFDFGTVFVGQAVSESLLIVNVGTDVLHVLHLVPTAPQFSVSDSVFSLGPAQNRTVFVNFHPLSVGNFSGELLLASDDPDAPLVHIPVAGKAVPAPDIDVHPDSVAVTLVVGQSTDRTLTIANTGGSPLSFDIPQPLLSAPSVIQPALRLAKGDRDPRVGPPVLDGRGGPDGYGYRWIDSDEPDGPAFQWIDITPFGQLAPVFGDEDVAFDIPLGFGFPFYGDSAGNPRSFNTVNIAANGWLAFNDYLIPSYSLQPLPSYFAPSNMVAPYWSDLDLQGIQRIYTYSDGNRFIASWVNVPHYSSGGPFTFQAILDQSGAITFQYLAMDSLDFSSIGIQNGDRTIGLPVAYFYPYVHNGLAVRIEPLARWLEVTPVSGVIPAGGSTNVTLHFDTEGLSERTYATTLFVRSNDPDENPVAVPVRLEVVVLPDIDATAHDFGTHYVGTTTVESVALRNTGVLPLVVNSLTRTGSSFALVSPPSVPFTIAGHDSLPLQVRFAPTAACNPCIGDIAVGSNDPDENPFHVPLSGVGVVPPQVEVQPSSIRAALAPSLGSSAASTERTLSIRNGGGSVLDVHVKTGFAAAAAPEIVGSAPGANDSPTALRTRGGGHADAGDEGDVAATAALADAQAPRPPRTQASGGPDDFGHVWIDSDTPGGPIFSWIDIAQPANRLPLTGDDRIYQTIPLGFDFPFYDRTFDTVNLSTNGYLSFTSTVEATSANTRLPKDSLNVPENLIAPFWDNLNFSSVQRAYARHDGLRFVAEWYLVNTAAIGGGPYTFEIILDPDGMITFQYLRMQGVLYGATVGIQNDTRTDGLTVAFNQNYIHDNLVVQFRTGPKWLRVDSSPLHLAPGATANLAVHLDATGLVDGDYGAMLDVRSNDVETPSLPVPVNLHVGAITVEFNLKPHNFVDNGHGKRVKGTIKLPNAYEPDSVVIPSIRVQNSVAPDPTRNVDIHGHDVKVEFNRRELIAQIPTGASVPVRVIGELSNQTWFTGIEYVRMRRPVVNMPVATSYVRGTHLNLSWTDPDSHPATSYELWYSADDGETWTVVALGLTQRAYQWNVPQQTTESALLELVAIDADGPMGTWLSTQFRIVSTGTLDAERALPVQFGIRGMGPNPTRGTATFELAIPTRAAVSINVFDVRGARVRNLARREFEPGWHQLDWDGTRDDGGRVGAGVYFIRAESAGKSLRARIAILR